MELKRILSRKLLFIILFLTILNGLLFSYVQINGAKSGDFFQERMIRKQLVEKYCDADTQEAREELYSVVTSRKKGEDAYYNQLTDAQKKQ